MDAVLYCEERIHITWQAFVHFAEKYGYAARLYSIVDQSFALSKDKLP